MTAVERVGWLDTQASNFMREIITKENKISDSFLSKDGDEIPDDILDPPAPKAPELPPPVDPATLTPAEAQRKLGVELSKNMWRRCNPGYTFGTHAQSSVSRSDYKYDAEEVEPCDKKNFRRRDGFTHYVEASARYKLLMK
eukprot:CAMPEP_0183790262 /NCGR_PEP_ID=MMETSP0803_2-20130417/910_1 /TAXON_ID=195967 /ORGANISM="Crustomastix stigmata, Strain CCMP3273" /LENGTH=140 /DNA_ID=CAMNT_0026034465 /DNA_START=45 /DNA_END=464 /DNA_ORIENTATION=-